MSNIKNKETRKLIRKMHKEGWSNRAIGRELGVPESTIRYYINGKTWSGEGLLQYDPEDVTLSKKQQMYLEQPTDLKIYGGCSNLSRIPKEYREAEEGTEEYEVYQHYSRMMESVNKNISQNGILFVGLNEYERDKLIEDVRSGKYKFTCSDAGKPLVLDKVYEDRITLRVEDTKPKIVVDNSRILLISDLHIPYNHPDALDFLQHLKDKYNPTRVICMGDELDKHALSFHDSDPDLPSAGDELRMSLPVIAKLKEMFPVMDILESNHGSLLYRKAHAFGIPKHYLKSYNDVLGVDSGWKWHYDITVDLPNGNKCYLHHGKSANVTKTSQTMSMCAAQGHYHETFKVEYWGNPVALYWAMQCGCLINDKSYAFNYNNVNLKRPVIGTGLIIDSLPVLEPMVLDKNGRWIGR